MKKGKLIVIEGGEGSGKDACAEYLREKLKDSPDVRFTREPGGTEVGKEIRKILLDPENMDVISVRAELLLFAADRANHCDLVLRPALSGGKNVICNRFDIATIAYQIFGRERLEYREAFEMINSFSKGRWSEEGMVKPDLVIWLDVDPKIGISRKHEQGEITRFEEEELAFHERVHQGYLDQYNAEVNNSWHKVNANRPLEEVKEEVWVIVKTFLVFN